MQETFNEAVGVVQDELQTPLFAFQMQSESPRKFMAALPSALEAVNEGIKPEPAIGHDHAADCC